MEHLEYWRDVKGFEDRYRISSKGRLYSKLQRKILKPCVDKYGYLHITLYNKGLRKHMQIHRIVALNFIETLDTTLSVNHKNHIKTDNRKDNLEWCTNYENNRLRSEFRGGKTSKLVGVRYHSNSKWQSRISIKSKTYHLGLFSTEIEAHEAYLNAYNNYYKLNILPK